MVDTSAAFETKINEGSAFSVVKYERLNRDLYIFLFYNEHNGKLYAKTG